LRTPGARPRASDFFLDSTKGSAMITAAIVDPSPSCLRIAWVG
jgi:hypothetical protein